MNDLQELSTFSHEINNSLTLIYGQIQCIEKTYDTLTGNDHWNRMKDDFSSLFDFSSAFPVFTSITGTSRRIFCRHGTTRSNQRDQ